MHERQSIREAVIAALIAADTAAGVRVYSTRISPIRTAEIPAINVFTAADVVKEGSELTAPRELTRTVTLLIEGWIRVADGVEDALDALALEIETAMDADLNLSETAFDSVLVGSETAIKVDGDRPMGAVQLEYAVTYHTDLRAAVAVDNFDTADVRHSLAGEQATADQAHDLVEGIHE